MRFVAISSIVVLVGACSSARRVTLQAQDGPTGVPVGGRPQNSPRPSLPDAAVAPFDTPWSTRSSPSGGSLFAVWGSGPTDVFLVGDNSGYNLMIMRSDGSTWFPAHADVRGRETLHEYRAIWGTSANDVFVGAVGPGGCRDDCCVPGYILHYGGSGWSKMDTGLATYGLWGSGSKNVFAVAYDCGRASSVILQYDGAVWKEVASHSSVLAAIWGSGPSDVFAVGGVILHFNGQVWSQLSIPTDVQLNAVWGSGPSNVFAGGENGTILHFDGTSWTAMNSGIKLSCNGIWGSSSTNVWAIADGSPPDFAPRAILHYDGTSWSITHVSTGRLSAIWGSSANNVYAVGGDKLLRFPFAGDACSVCNDCAVGHCLCTDLDHDTRNCGMCGTACRDGESCIAGACVCGKQCEDDCPDLQFDTRNCGACGNVCDLCLFGKCIDY